MNLSPLKNIKYKKRTACAVCGRKLKAAVIDLPSLPITELYIKKVVIGDIGKLDQGLQVCERCGHGQLMHVPDQKVLYGDLYSFRTSNSMSVEGNDVFLSFINRVTGKKRFGSIIEIGCNDLYLLRSLKGKADKLLGVDPLLKGREDVLSEGKVRVIGDFFENVDPQEYKSSKDTLVLSSHVIEHIEEPSELIKNLTDGLDSDTMFVFQLPGFDSLVNGFRFDQIFHHHLHYFDL